MNYDKQAKFADNMAKKLNDKMFNFPVSSYSELVIEGFEKKFYDINCPGFGEHTEKCYEYSKIKQFILSSLQTQRELFIKCIPEAEEIFLDCYDFKDGVKAGRNNFREEILENIKKI